MKLTVTGATGFIGSEVIRQAVRHPAVTSVVALSRKSVSFPTNVGHDIPASKLQSVILKDWSSVYPEDVKQHLRDADACIWLLAITPTKSDGMDFTEVTKICNDYTINGIASMTAVAHKPFRFVYASGHTIERDQSKAPLPFLSDYRLMRGRTENALLDFAQKHHTDLGVEVTVSKPAGIKAPGHHPRVSAKLASANLPSIFGDIPEVHLSELAAAMIDQCVNGITKDPLWNEDLIEIGRRVLQEEDYLTEKGHQQTT